VSLIGSGALRWSIFDILRGARLLNGMLPACLTGRAKFDMFERFAQKRRSTHFYAKTAGRNKFEDNLAERLGLDPKGRRLGGRLSRIFDN
jgi:hypothetical protein